MRRCRRASTGSVNPSLGARVDEHLAGCPACRDWQAAAVEQTQLLRRLAGRSQLAAVGRPAAGRPRSVLRDRSPGGGGRWAASASSSWVSRWPRVWARTWVFRPPRQGACAARVDGLVGRPRGGDAGGGDPGRRWQADWRGLASFAAFLALYEIIDTDEGRITIDRR